MQPCQTFDLEGYLRVTVGLPQENAAFVDELRTLATANRWNVPCPTAGTTVALPDGWTSR